MCISLVTACHPAVRVSKAAADSLWSLIGKGHLTLYSLSIHTALGGCLSRFLCMFFQFSSVSWLPSAHFTLADCQILWSISVFIRCVSCVLWCALWCVLWCALWCGLWCGLWCAAMLNPIYCLLLWLKLS